MAFLDVHAFSDSLGVQVSFYVLLPQAARRQIGVNGGEARAQYQTLYLLHGLSDDHTIWQRRTSIERYAAAKNLAVVMPAVGRSFYQDMVGAKYWTFVSEELPALCQQWFPLSPKREDNFVAGLSMGGYGAMRLGLGKPDKFAAAASLSGALDVEQRISDGDKKGSRLTKLELQAIFGQDLAFAGSDADLFALAHKVAGSPAAQPHLYICCGTEDPLLADNRKFRTHLDSIHLDVTYEEGLGTHEWGYWDKQIQRVIEWLPLK